MAILNGLFGVFFYAKKINLSESKLSFGFFNIYWVCELLKQTVNEGKRAVYGLKEVVKIRELVAKTNHFLEQEILTDD